MRYYRSEAQLNAISRAYQRINREKNEREIGGLLNEIVKVQFDIETLSKEEINKLKQKTLKEHESRYLEVTKKRLKNYLKELCKSE